ncbi:ATP-binding cassette domain-containing protein [Streptomyces sp. ITFR-6]|uniref:ATP-binding cassette domain-containing protein n=1 Tax=Streptomyces sp. ITFR-6 TaxID=3075197 RepID=UPI0037DA5BAC
MPDTVVPAGRTVLLAERVRVRLGGREQFTGEGVDLTIRGPERIALTGPNGAGESTVLRLINGELQPEAGEIRRSEGRIAYLSQRLDLLDLDRSVAENFAASAPHRPEAERMNLLARFLFRGDSAHLPVRALSGGERLRATLACVLCGEPAPQLLLLDEPTNHLDDEAAAFVEEQLRGMPGPVVIASHDRAFLDAVCTDLIDLDPAVDGPVRYGGGYSAYLAVKRAERARWERRHAEEQQEIEALRRSADVTARQVAPDRGPRDSEKMGYGLRAGRVQSQIARRVRNASRRLAELERRRAGEPPQPLRFRHSGLADASAEGTLVSLRGVRVPGRLAVDRLDVAATERLLVTGGNGAGKSTLLAVLAGRLTPQGQVSRRPGLTVGLLAQDTRFARPDRTVRDTYERALGADRAEEVPLTSLGLMHEADLDKQVGRLSAGQRRRLALALLTARPPQLLLLDEPTNHLSPLLCDELEEALGTGPGAVVLASHDRWLRERWQGCGIRLQPERAAVG